ncbi:biotin transporter BioY [Paralimibaculum aggregatum]|uniref:Biotin transporter n=1 Tax=Paralimibaculum aggregatum TaxID=3036245 RepID=A0ABQ6LPL7_9RHOB|nr:biotin transporter BioY [Limibaculum sp. NKW23]GMG84305.1 biotin transporter BioY [Limibaculum sp. NKW23]
MKLVATPRVTLAGQAAWLLPIAAGAAALAIAAQIRIPFWPVPMTMQVLAVLLIGWFGGMRTALGSGALYLGLGAAGLPFFAGGALFGPTGGYLVGFVLAAAALGAWRERCGVPGLAGIAALNLAATGLIYALGWGWLAAITGDPAAAFAAGVVPFLLGDALKIAVASLVVARFARR